MADHIVDIVVETGPAGHFVVLKSDGHEISRARYDSRDEAMRWGKFYADYAKRKAAAIGMNA